MPVLAAIGVIAGTPVSAHASHGVPHVAIDPANVDETARVLEAASPLNVSLTPASPGSVGSAATWADEAYAGIQELPVTTGAQSGSPAAISNLIHSETAAVQRSTGFLPKLAKWGKLPLVGGGLAGFVALATGSYLIGKIFSPPDQPAVLWNLDGFRLQEKGATVAPYCGLSDQYRGGMSCAQAYGSAVYTATETQRLYVAGQRSDFWYCPTAGGQGTTPAGILGGIPEGATIVETYTEPGKNVGTCGQSDWVHFVLVDALEASELSPAGNPIGPGGSQIALSPASACSTNWDCPTSANAETRIADALASGAYPQLSRWLDHNAAPELFPDPTVTQVSNENYHRCDFGDPAFENPGGNLLPDPWEPRPEGSFEAVERPSGASSAPDPILRWGTAEWGGAYIDDWDGWGYRHIQAKHGWSSDDILATALALAAPVDTSQSSETSMVYHGAEIEQNGAVCQRRVIVQYDPAAPHGIITSYNAYIGEVEAP